LHCLPILQSKVIVCNRQKKNRPTHFCVEWDFFLWLCNAKRALTDAKKIIDESGLEVMSVIALKEAAQKVKEALS